MRIAISAASLSEFGIQNWTSPLSPQCRQIEIDFLERIQSLNFNAIVLLNRLDLCLLVMMLGTRQTELPDLEGGLGGC